MATIRFWDRTARWPSSWKELETDLDDVIGQLSDLHQKRKLNADPFAMAESADPYWGAEASQSISARAPDVSDFTPASLRKLVDVSFDADPKVLATQPWHKFSGIVPKKPSYNLYRVEFQKLIERLSMKTSGQQDATPTK